MVNTDKRKLYKTGFTLVEVLTAVAILSIGLVGGLTVITGNLRNISAGENRIIAAGLAAEGIELARNIRDTNWLEGAVWDDGFGILNIGDKRRLSFFCGGFKMLSEGQGVGNWNKSISQCSTQCKTVMYTLAGVTVCYSDDFGPTEQDYNLVTYTRVNPRSEYYRLITATRTGQDSILVESFIKWKNPNGAFVYLPPVEETLYNWK